MAAPAFAAVPPRPKPSSVGGLELEFVTVEGMRVRLGHRRATRAAPVRGTVVVLPGRAEFIEKYGETLDKLDELGFASAILDWRGQGGSDRYLDRRLRGHVPQVEAYLADLDAVMARVKQLDLPQPFSMLAHSMGGHIGLRYMHAHAGAFAAAAMTAPMFGIALNAMPERLADAICRVAIGLGAGRAYAPGQSDLDLDRRRFDGNRLTSCPEHFASLGQLLAAAPELALGGVTYGWLGAALRSIALIRRPGYLESIRTPILVCQAGLERIVSNRAQIEFVRRLPQARLAVFAEARHELLYEREPVRAQLFATIDAFLTESLS
ncbi:MAG: alpha/beta hydrolase [Geminicoccaceae bacterium]